MPISVFVLDDHEIVRRGVTALLEATDDIQVVGEARTAAEACARIPVVRPDAAVLDVRLRDGDGVMVCQQVRATTDPPPVCLMFTSYSDDEVLFGAIMAGAAGYLLKQVPANEVVAAVRTVAARGSLLDPNATRLVLDRLRHGHPDEDLGYAALSAQERRVLTLVASGLTNREIGARLYLSEKTVKNYVSAMLHKLGLTRRTQAAVYAIEHGCQRPRGAPL
ncbi:response regulator [Pseudonocardia halophobica]|uniref:response regulator transcription factor n=1 Tax=Pseudonocardia halophobica TaxID=29401 RepID=UPI003D936028